MKHCKHRTHRQYTNDKESLCRRCVVNHRDFWKWKLPLMKTGVVNLSPNIA